MRAVVLLSGGLDSATALAQWVKRYGAAEVAALGIDYGARHNARELASAAQLAEHYGVRFELLDFSSLGPLLWSSLTCGEGSLRGAATVVPNRNAILLMTAAAWAESLGAIEVVFGGHAGDAAVYADCRPEFVAELNAALWVTSNLRVQIRQPFRHLDKPDLGKLARELGVPLEMTWSCYAGGEEPCGECGACQQHARAGGCDAD